MTKSAILETLNKNVGGVLKKVAKLIGAGIGDKMDKVNLRIIPGFTILVFVCLWTIKLTKLALEESTCETPSIYIISTQTDLDSKKHCQSGKRYYLSLEEENAFVPDQKWLDDRLVNNSEWILWLWAPILIMCELTRFAWKFLVHNKGINFPSVFSAARSVVVKTDGVRKIVEEKLQGQLSVIDQNNRKASSSWTFAGYIVFKFVLVLAPILLLNFVLPMIIGANYRFFGLDVARAWWEHKDWQGVPLTPAIAFSPAASLRPQLPLIPRTTYCDYHFISDYNEFTLIYRCYLDANWHERTALFIWFMLAFLAFLNIINFFSWIKWTIRMKFPNCRKRWVLRKWLNNGEGFSADEKVLMGQFAKEFKSGNLLFFYFIQAHTDRVVASAFCQALLEERQHPHQCNCR